MMISNWKTILSIAGAVCLAAAAVAIAPHLRRSAQPQDTDNIKMPEITIFVSNPDKDGELTEIGTKSGNVRWISSAQMGKDSFRTSVEEAFGCETKDGKTTGCLYQSADGMPDENAVLSSAFANKEFLSRWSDAQIREKLALLAADTYADIEKDSPYAAAAVLSRFYDLLPAYEDPTAFNPGQPVTREEFYLLVRKATEPAPGAEDADANDFRTLTGIDDAYSGYLSAIAGMGFLSPENKSFDTTAAQTEISRAEAVYLLAQVLFPDRLAAVKSTESAFSDTKYGGDVGSVIGYKIRYDSGKTVEKERWQAYTVDYLCRNSGHGLQAELYRAFVIAKRYRIITDEEARWNEMLTRAEAVELTAAFLRAVEQADYIDSHADEETEPADTETEPVDTEPVDTDTEPVDTDTEPVDTDTEPIDTETEPVDTETDPPVDTDTNPTSDVVRIERKMYATVNVKERIEPKDDAEYYGAIYAGDAVTVHTLDRTTGWCSVTYNQKQYTIYVQWRYLSENPPQKEPVVTEPVDTGTEPVDTDTEPLDTDTEPVESDTEPVETESGSESETSEVPSDM